jgi:hypothetical protein
MAGKDEIKDLPCKGNSQHFDQEAFDFTAWATEEKIKVTK